LEINKTYLSHNYHTDIITFDLSENTQDIQAEIYISIDRVRDNAKTLKTTVKEELHRVIFHGVLHLCGYKDKTKSSQAEMRKAEDYYLQKYSALLRST
jgi:rRNA maturation RNase YbeY